jgi:hypothetical protein
MMVSQIWDNDLLQVSNNPPRRASFSQSPRALNDSSILRSDDRSAGKAVVDGIDEALVAVVELRDAIMVEGELACGPTKKMAMKDDARRYTGEAWK